jgi:peptidoglycan/LPS O-acetylase OafA/YrhL
VLVALGDASYALYLSHPFVLQATAKILWSHPGIGPVALTAITVALALPVALILNRFVERPAQAALIHRLGRPVPRLAIGTRSPGGALSKP